MGWKSVLAGAISKSFNRYSSEEKLILVPDSGLPGGLGNVLEATWTAYQSGDWEWNNGDEGRLARWANYAAFLDSAWYQDGLLAWKNTNWLKHPDFMRSYEAACRHVGMDYRVAWRTHVALWAARLGLRRKGHFVEFGTGRGWMAAALLEGLSPDLGRDRELWLFDRFESTEVDSRTGVEGSATVPVYADGAAVIEPWLDEYPAVKTIVGDVRSTLPSAIPAIDAVAFVHFDLNAADPEIEALAIVWPKLGHGSVLLLDDYGFPGLEAQQCAWDQAASRHGFEILAVPTGQGLVLL